MSAILVNGQYELKFMKLGQKFMKKGNTTIQLLSLKKTSCIMFPSGEHVFLRSLSTTFLKTISNFEVLKSTSEKTIQK